jgi:uncharacterized damage-inducible protein DinB
MVGVTRFDKGRLPRTILLHALLHAMRHYAQLSTLVRQAGFATGFASDYLLMDAERV